MAAPFTMTRRVLFYETDLAGVMHFSNYFRLMEEVEHAWWRSLGRSVHAVDGAEVMSWPRVSASCDFTAPVQFEDELELRLAVAALGEKSLTVEVAFFKHGQPVARGQMRSVCCHMQAGKFKAVPIPADLRRTLQTWQGPA
ncbi:MAG TPA: thioesterase family protein [Phycisphaerae bacterium]|nr:thioesterase family protein [Phycisphaerae bacterium]